MLKFVEEISIDSGRSHKSLLTPGDLTSLRGCLGTVSRRVTQSAPQYLADVSMLLSEVKTATIGTLHQVNKLVREMRREAAQELFFPCWNRYISDLAVIPRNWTHRKGTGEVGDLVRTWLLQYGVGGDSLVTYA